MANIYFNELDWELAKENLEFVRYADDSIVMCKSKEELEKAKVLVHDTLEKLGLELAEDKSDDIDFHNKDFDFLGFTFNHIRLNKNGDRVYYTFGPSIKSLKKFKSDIKAKTKKSWTYSFEKWKEILNPILRGKFNYFLIPFEVKKELEPILKEMGRTMYGIPALKAGALDGYVRQRLRVSFSCRGKKHGGQTQGKLLTVKYGNEFFVKDMGLVTGEYLKCLILSPNLSIDDFLTIQKERNKRTYTNTKDRFFKFAYAK